MYLSKKKYKREEVERLINSVSAEYESKLLSQKNRISLLLDENKRLTAELGMYEDKENLILSTLKDAEEKAEELKENARLRYDLTVEQLKNFSVRWRHYFDYLLEKYPLYPEIIKATEIVAELNKHLNSGESPEITVSEANTAIERAERRAVFNPKEKIEAYFASEEKTGFNMEEVLNPGELKLEDLCRELGLTEDD